MDQLQLVGPIAMYIRESVHSAATKDNAESRRLVAKSTEWEMNDQVFEANSSSLDKSVWFRTGEQNTVCRSGSRSA